VFEQIAGCIRSGPADSRLATERELTTMFNTRRPTIREAIYRAELVGLVEVRRGAGTFVVGPKSRAPE
jgi:DNA-binding FadR family transcriptional regulator